MLDLEPATRTLQRAADGIADDRLGATTPCDVSAERVLAHVLGLSVAFREAARKVTGPLTDAAPGLADGELPPDWRAQLPVVLDELARGVARPRGVGGHDACGRPGPARRGGRRRGDERARAARVGPRRRDRAAVRARPGEPGDGVADGVADAGRRPGPAGAVRPVVPVPEDAPLLDRVLGGAGRDPRWTPPA